MKSEEVNRILQETEAGYNQMAGKFSETRKFFWRDLEFVKEYAKGNVLDYGCGNGRLVELVNDKNVEYYGIDVSEKLIDICQEKYQKSPAAHFQKISSQEISLPFPDDFFNAAYAIAVFHHFPSKEHREKAAKELFRTTNPGGFIIVAVWDLWQKRYWKKIVKNWFNKVFKKSSLNWNDCYINFRNNEGEIFERYHHAFTRKEMEKLFKKAGFQSVKCAKLNKRNIIYIGKK